MVGLAVDCLAAPPDIMAISGLRAMMALSASATFPNAPSKIRRFVAWSIWAYFSLKPRNASSYSDEPLPGGRRMVCDCDSSSSGIRRGPFERLGGAPTTGLLSPSVSGRL
jgi:hypothetical protein